jgi:3-hydroxyacyl-[acyl-carrier-protein] dehydratase
MDIQKILEYLPHRYPFLLVDRVLSIEVGKSIKALKNITFNEPFFTGHFPDRPVMPGVLMLEALAQASGLLAYETMTLPEGHSPFFYFAGIDDARFKRIVYPGDQLILEAEITHVRRDLWKFNCKATVEGQLACSASLMAARRDEKK